MIDEQLRSSIDALLRSAADATPLPWDNEKWSNLTNADFSFVVFALGTAPEMARLLLDQDQTIEVEKMSREERTINGDRLDKYIALQLAALEARLVAEFQPKIDALRTDAAALEAATARAVAAEGRAEALDKELARVQSELYQSKHLLSDSNSRADAFKTMLFEAGLDPSKARVILTR